MKYLWSTMLLAALFFTQSAWAKLELRQVPQGVNLEGKLGGRMDGAAWHSGEMKGKVHVLFYVDPDLRDLNNDASEALKAESFPREKYQPLAVINVAASRLPKFLVKSSLKKKQKRYPDTIYVRDNKKIIVKAWEIDDENNNVLAFDKEGRLFFIKEGKLNPGEIKDLIELIYQHLEK